MNQLFSQTESNMNNYFIGTNNITEKYFNNATEKCNDYADEAMKKVYEKTEHIINVIDNTKLNVNPVKIKEVGFENDVIMTDVEKKSRQFIIRHIEQIIRYI